MCCDAVGGADQGFVFSLPVPLDGPIVVAESLILPPISSPSVALAKPSPFSNPCCVCGSISHSKSSQRRPGEKWESEGQRRTPGRQPLAARVVSHKHALRPVQGAGLVLAPLCCLSVVTAAERAVYHSLAFIWSLFVFSCTVFDNWTLFLSHDEAFRPADLGRRRGCAAGRARSGRVDAALLCGKDPYPRLLPSHNEYTGGLNHN